MVYPPFGCTLNEPGGCGRRVLGLSHWLFMATSEAVHPCQSGGDAVRAGHRGHDPRGLAGVQTAGCRDVERSLGGAADHVDCVSRGAERCFRDTDDRNTERVRRMSAETRPTFRVEGGVAVDDEKFERWPECQDRPNAREFAFEQRSRFIGGCRRDVNNILGVDRGEGESVADDQRCPGLLVVEVVDVNCADCRCGHGEESSRLRR